MESDNLQASQEILTCFICLGIFTDLVLTRCGHPFCRACLLLFSADTQIPIHCPLCRHPSKPNFRTAIPGKKLISIVRKERIKKYLSSEEHKCMTHKERKTIFCDENRVLLCQLCSKSQEHRGHRHCHIEEAVLKQMVSDVSEKIGWELERGRLSRPQEDSGPNSYEAIVFLNS